MDIDIKTMEFENVEDIFTCLLEKLDSVKHDDYESVKLYGNGDLMLEIIKLIMRSSKYDHIKIGYINFAASWFDRFLPDEYILEISEDFEICVQSAWNGEVPFLNESKFSLCMSYCSYTFIRKMVEENADFVVCNLKK